EKLKNKVTSIDTSVSSLNALKSQVSDLSKATASEIKYNDLALAITNNDTNKNALATAIASNPNKLGEALASSIGTNTTVIQSLQDKLGTNTTFQTAMADTLSSDKYKVKFQGPKGADGNIGDGGALKSNLFDQGRTMWCADGDLCKIPQGKKGIDWGYGASKIYDDGQLRINSDDNIHFNINNNEKMHINNDRVRIPVLETDRINIGGWNIRQDGDHLVFRRGDAGDGDNQAHLRMAADGNFWVSRSSRRGWVADGLGDLYNRTNALKDKLNNHQHQFRQYAAAWSGEGTTWGTRDANAW
ncbi:MAG: hypothetical protein EBU90_24170, partial [Proteobacteria bacterium]|nr:hypothetical protein [Pseudomonadota bacterium]